jgi:uncharacterized protein (UPF0332 family)/predicted nucleotidyltransferase
MAVSVSPPQSRVTPRLPRKVRAALADFQRRARALFPDDLLALILYGSYARGEATPDSDVDVLLVGRWADPDGRDAFYSPGFGDARWEQISRAADESTRRGGPHLSVIMFSEKEFNTNLPLARDAKQEGIILWQREGWSMSTEEEEHPSEPYNPETWQRMANERAEEARKAFSAGLLSSAIHTAYYAMFYAARAALLTRGVFLKKHSAAVEKFSELFVQPALVEEKYKDYLRDAQETREDSDYKPYIPISRDTVADILSDAEAFIAKMKELIEGKQEAQ